MRIFQYCFGFDVRKQRSLSTNVDSFTKNVSKYVIQTHTVEYFDKTVSAHGIFFQLHNDILASKRHRLS